jgi:hypothetical protein
MRRSWLLPWLALGALVATTYVLGLLFFMMASSAID